MRRLALDIETLPCTDEQVIAELGKTIKAPATYKKPESIAEWMAANYSAELMEKVYKTSFDGLYGSIACICYAFDDGEIFSVDSRKGEKEMLKHFYTHVFDLSTVAADGRVVDIDLQIVGHNVAGFDLPFLKHRSIINSVKPIRQFQKAMRAKPWDDCIADTMLMWSSDSQKRVSMDKLCRALGIPGKGDFDGSMVASTWPTDPEKVIAYCKEDVERTRQIFNRLTWS